MQCLILHIPHSSSFVPKSAGYIVEDAIIQNEILELTDWYTDELFSTKTDTVICAPFSRVFCDVERFSNDDEEIMSRYGMGVLYTTTDNGQPMRVITENLRKEILDEYYFKHHAALKQAVHNQLSENGTALIIDCHSFSDIPFKRDLNKRANRPDFNIGTDTFHTPDPLIRFTNDFFESRGYSVGMDWPYSGTMVPMEFYKSDSRVMSIMIEINRKLYLQKGTNIKNDNYCHVKALIKEYLKLVRESFLE